MTVRCYFFDGSAMKAMVFLSASRGHRPETLRNPARALRKGGYHPGLLQELELDRTAIVPAA